MGPALSPRYNFLGQFNLDQPKDAQGRYNKTQPPKKIDNYSTNKEADFLQFGHETGVLCIECKNYREWIYPGNTAIKELIIKASDLNATPLLVVRRLHYTTITNLLEPAGILAHETYHQYFPGDKAELANAARQKDLLGFTDISSKEEPEPRTLKFFCELLPKIVDRMAARWQSNKKVLIEYANDRLNLAQLYTEIGSPAGGKWKNHADEPDSFEHGMSTNGLQHLVIDLTV